MRTRKIFIILFLLMFSVSAQVLAGEELTGREIIEKMETVTSVNDMQAEMVMRIIHRSGKERIRELKTASSKNDAGVEKSLIRFLSPADVRGTGFLSIDRPDGADEQYLYLPALGKPRRLSSEERGGSFMGSDLSYEDLSPTIDDYTYTLISTEEIGDKEVYVVESQPVSAKVREDVGFAKKIYWIRKDIMTLIKAEFADSSGTVIKLMEVSQIKQIEGKFWLGTKIDIKDLEDGSRTVLEYRNIEINSGLTDNNFTIRQLTRPL